MNGENLVKVSVNTTHGQLLDVNKKKQCSKIFGRILDHFRRS